MKIINIFKGNIFVLLAWLVWLGLHLTHTELKPEMGLIPMTADAAVIFIVMLGCVFSTTRHAEHLSTLLKEPFGTLVLTLSVTAIEVSLMLEIMLTGQPDPSMLRDTVFATLMIMMNGLIGLSLLMGSWRHFEQSFNLRGALSFLHLIAPLSLILLAIPNNAISSTEPVLIPIQEVFLGSICILVYSLFLFMQTTKHRKLFEDNTSGSELVDDSVQPIPHKHHTVFFSSLSLILAVTPIVLLAEFLGEFINYGIEELHAPTELGGLIIATLVLVPEGLGACRAALGNQMQRAVNICLGSALATIALTVPTVILVSGLKNLELVLGVSSKNETLLYASLFTILITIMSGRTTALQGHVHLMLFCCYLFLIFYP